MRIWKALVYHFDFDGGEYGDCNVEDGLWSIFSAVRGSPGGNIGFVVWFQDIPREADCCWRRRLACLERCWTAALGINPSSMKDRQFPVRDGKIRSVSLEPIIEVLSISEGLDADVTGMEFEPGEL